MADPGYDKSIADTWASMQATGVAGVARRRMVHDDDEEMRNPYEDPPVITQLSQSPNQSPNVEQLIQHSNTHPNLSDLAAYVPFINGEGEERTQSATELAYNAHALNIVLNNPEGPDPSDYFLKQFIDGSTLTDEDLRQAIQHMGDYLPHCNNNPTLVIPIDLSLFLHHVPACHQASVSTILEQARPFFCRVEQLSDGSYHNFDTWTEIHPWNNIRSCGDPDDDPDDDGGGDDDDDDDGDDGDSEGKEGEDREDGDDERAGKRKYKAIKRKVAAVKKGISFSNYIIDHLEKVKEHISDLCYNIASKYKSKYEDDNFVPRFIPDIVFVDGKPPITHEVEEIWWDNSNKVRCN